MKILKEKKLPASNRKTIRHFHARLRELAEYDFIGDIRYIGFIGAIDLVKSRQNKKAFDKHTRIGNIVYKKSLKNGLVLRPLGDTIYWFLPITTKKKDIDIIIKKSIKVIREAVESVDV